MEASLSKEKSSFSDYFQMFVAVAVALEDDLYIGKIKKVYKKRVTVFYFKKVREGNEPSVYPYLENQMTVKKKSVKQAKFS